MFAVDARRVQFDGDGKYYLGDAGFPSCDALLVLYHGVRYHLKEWAQGNQQYILKT